MSGLTIISPLSFSLTLIDGQVIETIRDAAAYFGMLSPDQLDRHHWQVAVTMLDNALDQPTYLLTATISLQTALMLDRLLVWPLTVGGNARSLSRNGRVIGTPGQGAGIEETKMSATWMSAVMKQPTTKPSGMLICGHKRPFKARNF